MGWITPWDGCTWWPGSTLVFSSPVPSLSSLTRERNLLREKRWLTKRRENKLLLKHRISTDLRVSRNTGKSEEEEKEVEDRGGGVGRNCCMMEGEESGVERKERKGCHGQEMVITCFVRPLLRHLHHVT